MFKDITWGVLFEQQKAKEQLQNLLDKAAYQKIRKPLENVVQTCMSLENSKNLKMFENFIHQSKTEDSTLRTKLEIMRKESELIIYRFKDMRDWTTLSRGSFTKSLEAFTLDRKLNDVQRIMIQYANNKDIEIIIDVDFEKKEGFNHFKKDSNQSTEDAADVQIIND